MRRFRFALLIAATTFALAGLMARGPAMDVPTMHGEPHMEMTIPAAEQPGDAARANAILAAARSVMAEYPTVEAAEKGGFEKFLPGIPLPIEHYTNKNYAIQALLGPFDPEHPTSLIFERNGQTLELVGVMYTASNRADRDDLNARVPLSYGTWHRHVNFCKAPPGTPLQQSMPPNARFGFAGSIATKNACVAAGGTFKPVVFGWMVHVWPNEKTRAEIWAVDRHGSMQNVHGMEMNAPQRP